MELLGKLAIQITRSGRTTRVFLMLRYLADPPGARSMWSIRHRELLGIAVGRTSVKEVVLVQDDFFDKSLKAPTVADMSVDAFRTQFWPKRHYNQATAFLLSRSAKAAWRPDRKAPGTLVGWSSFAEAEEFLVEPDDLILSLDNLHAPDVLDPFVFFLIAGEDEYLRWLSSACDEMGLALVTCDDWKDVREFLRDFGWD